MELSGPKIEKVLIFSQKKLFLKNFQGQKNKITCSEKFLIFRKMELPHIF